MATAQSSTEAPIPHVTPTQRRNIVFIGHSGAGKTALAEALLYRAGVTTRIGKTTEGSSHFDFEAEEIKHGSSLSTAIYDFNFRNSSITLLDTPGSSSFIVDAQSAIRAADVAVLVTSAVSGVKVQGEKGWALATVEGLSRAIFINELDRERASFDTAMQAITKTIDAHPVVMNFPVGVEGNFIGVIDVLSQRAFISNEKGVYQEQSIPLELRDAALGYYTELVERVAETDEALLEKYVAGKSIAEDELRTAFAAAFAAREIVPVFCGSALTLHGVERFLEEILLSFPSPVDRAPYFEATTDGELKAVAVDEGEPLSAYIFKTIADPFTGQVSLVRVVSGVLSSDGTVLNPTSEITERVGKLHLQMGKEHKQIASAGPGQIVAVAKLKASRTGDTLCSSTVPRKLRPLIFPEAAMSFAVEPKSRADEDKMHAAIQRLALEDPGIHIHRDMATNETILSGNGQNHIEITLERLHRKYHVDMILHAPKVPYRETIRRKAEAQGRHKKQSGGRGQFGDCWLRIAPLKRGAGFKFNNEIFGGAIPKNYIPAIEKGVIEAMSHGFLAGYQIVDVECTVYDGSYHAVDSSDLAFKIAASKGFKLAMEKADAVLLEPVMLAEINIPDDTTGAVIGDLNARRARVLSMDANGHTQVINAEVPLAEMLTYAATLNSITGDRGSFHLELRGYEEVPAHIAQKVMAEEKRQVIAANDN